MLAGLIEQESCLSLKHSKCWDPASRLKTPREEGAGLGQVTRAFRPDGTLRFDKLQELRLQYPEELGELHWSTIYKRPDLQIRALILQSRDLYKEGRKRTKNPLDALAFADASYNGGLGGLDKERRACYISQACDPSKWFDNVERFCMKSKVALYGNRSACDINREHVTNVMKVRAQKYQLYFR